MEHHHNEEIEDAVLKDRPHQSGHTRLASVRFELGHEDDKADEGDNVCKNIRFLSARWTTVDTSKRNLRPICPLVSFRGDEGTPPERVERDVGHLKGYAWTLVGNNGGWICHALPFAEGAITIHTPVAKDEVTRIPKTTITYLLASVRAYTLGRTRLSNNRRQASVTTSPHRQEYEAERQDKDVIVPLQLYSAVASERSFRV